MDVLNLIDGVHAPCARGAWLDSIEPATGAACARVPDSSGPDVDRAVAAARRAFPAWAATPATERSRLLLKLADLIDANLDRLARAESMDAGKPISAARTIDIPRSAANLRYFATAILHTAGEMHDFDGGGTPGGLPAINWTLRSPRGVAACISPWNLPLYLFTWKIAPALATGNTVVAKPSEITPLTACILGELAVEAGFPPGVLNIIHGTGAEVGAALVQHPDVPTITFTGSTAVGRWIGQTAGRMLKRVSLELGGKNPFIIFADADLEGQHGAISTAGRAAFSNQGQICLCGSRLLVHESIYDRVVSGVVEHARTLKIGDPFEASTQFGAITSAVQLAKVESMVNEACAAGGRVLTGGRRVDPGRLPERCRAGFFYEPTVIEGLDPTCRAEREEIFGPVVTVQRFGTTQDALSLANATDYGLAASVFTRDLATASHMARSLQSGIVWVNCWMVRDLRTPFGGVKESGVGREGGNEALRFFTEPRNICIRQ
ncbi:MAG TPA: aldehyde dehydrogenase [Phycisphaerales bacterium]|nr:aldehyde dehydrogenase [Phycisphaerales bacterium]